MIDAQLFYASVELLIAARDGYNVSHNDDCDIMWSDDPTNPPPCTCGFENWLAAVEVIEKVFKHLQSSQAR